MKTYGLILSLQQSPDQTAKSMRFAASLLPKEVRHNTELEEFVAYTLNLAACCLTTVEQQFGTDALHPKSITGKVEHNLLATYHNGTHTRLMMMRDALAYAHMRRMYDGKDFFPDRDLVLLVFAASIHDAIQGDGRGVDEAESAELAVRVLQHADFAYTEDDIEKVRHAILATAFDPVTKQQSVTIERPFPHMQEALAIGDLLSLCRPDGPVYGVAHIPEFLQAVQGGYNEIFACEAAIDGYKLEGKNILDCLHYFDTNGKLRQAFGDCLRSQAQFFRQHTYHDPRVDDWFPHRPANANFISHRLVSEFDAGHITPLQVYELCQERARVLLAN